jgi:hypothetical protein
MAAGANQYRPEKLVISGATVVEHSIAIPTTTEAALKARFFLDKIYPVSTPAGDGFIGLNAVNSNNYHLHNTNKIGSLRFSGFSITPQLQYVAYVDAGLNTKGSGGILNVEGGVGALTIHGLFTSSYFAPNTANYIEVNGSLYSVGATAANTETVLNLVYEGGKRNDLLYLKAVVVNPEGTYTSSIYPHYLDIVPYTMQYSYDNASSAVAGVFNGANGSGAFTYDVYPEVSPNALTIGSRIYRDMDGIIGANAGYYAYNGKWYKLGSGLYGEGYVIDMDVYGTYHYGDPEYNTVYEEIEIYASSDSYPAGCYYPQNNIYHIYRSPDTGKYYSSNADTEQYNFVLPNGYYYTPSGVFYQIANGLLFNTYNCSNF